MRSGETSFFPPLLVNRRVSRVTCLEEGLDESDGRRGGDVKSERREYKRGREAAGTYLLGGNVDETTDVFEAEHDVTLVREVAIVLSDFTFLGVEAKWAQVEREEAAIRYLGEIFLGVGVGGVACAGSCRLVLLVLFARSSEGRFGTKGSRSSTKLVCAVGGLEVLGGRSRPRPGEERGHWKMAKRRRKEEKIGCDARRRDAQRV